MKISDKFLSAANGVGAIILPAAMVSMPAFVALAEGRETLGQNLAYAQVLACLAGAMTALGFGVYSRSKPFFAATALTTALALGYGVYEGTLNPHRIVERFAGPVAPAVK